MPARIASSVRLLVITVALLSATVMTGPAPTAQAESFPQIAKFCLPGEDGGGCANPRGVAVDPDNGHVFVVDSAHSRIQEFTAWGEFVKAWGWGVVASGPGNKPQNEIQQLSVDATGGTFVLHYGKPGRFDATKTGPIPYSATASEVQEALESAPEWVGANGEYADRFVPGDLAVTGPAGGPWEIEFLGQWEDSDFGGDSNFTGDNWHLYGNPAGLTGGAASASVTTLQNGGSFEVCVPANGDVCQQGSSGSAPGQLGGSADRLLPSAGAQGIALDSSGDIFVFDAQNHRVQKFSPSGELLLMFGGEVNKTTGADVCTKADLEGGDECGAASFGSPGSGEGQFAASTPRGDFLDVGPDDTVYVGDTGRVQTFATDGTFAGQIVGPVLAGEKVQSLAVDGNGDLYLIFEFEGSGLFVKEDVHKIDSSGNEIGLIEVGRPLGIATAPGRLYVIDRGNSTSEILGFDLSGQPLDLAPDAPGLGFGDADLIMPFGIAVTSPPTCGLTASTVVVGNANISEPYPAASFVALYGSAPDPDVCPPPMQAPTIAAQFATSVDSGSATLKARINPHFWADTRYFVEYGTGKCSEGGCDQEQPASPGSLLTSAVTSTEITSAGVFLTDLQPATTYHYRFVTQSGGGGPVMGQEMSFRTAPASAGAATCPNDAFRTGPSAKLPDCRAYELVSPLEKANGDVKPPLSAFAQAAESGQRMTFGSERAFADPQAAPLVGQYLASRGAAGWVTESISPPRGIPPLVGAPEGAGGLYRAFTPDLCHGWVIADTELTLAPEAPAEVPNMYRRNNCADGSYEVLSPSLVPSFGPIPGLTYYSPTIQGYSADATRSVFRANAALMVAEGGPRPPFVCSASKGNTNWVLTGPFQWLRDGAPIPGATERTYTSTPDDDGHSIQCQVSRSEAAGASLTTSEVSLVEPIAGSPPNPGTRVAAGNTSLPGAPSISGTPKAGETLTCTPGTWKGSPSFAFQWYRNATEITGETASTYVPIASDRGKSIQCRTIATNAAGSAVADSKSTVIEATLPFNETAPSISGTPSVGETLTCDPGSWSGIPSFSYQWLRGGANIVGATASTYALTAAEEGKAIQCRVAAANPDATVAEASPHLVVSPPPGTAPPEPTAPPSVSGEAVLGEVLTCDPGSWSGSPTFAYRWQRNGAPIAPLTSSNKAEYTLVAADLGKAIQCQVTATNAGGAVTAIDGGTKAVIYPASPAPPAAPFVSTQGNFQLYVSDEQGAQRLVSVLPDGSTSINPATVGTAWFGGLVISSREDQVRHAVSADASRVFWTLSDTFGGPEDPGVGLGRLYLRLNATEPQSAVSGGQCTEAAKACTISVSDSILTRFIAADPQGDRVIYALGQGGSAATLDLYEAEIEEEAGETVANSSLIASGFRGVMGASEDARRIYLVSTEVLSGSEQNSEGDTAQAGGQNLYLYEQGEGFDFIGALDPTDVFGGVISPGDGSTLPPSPVATRPNQRLSRVSPDGLHAAFTATAALTGYDNAHAIGGEPQGEVFVYDAEANGGEGELDCASCNPSGARPLGRLVHSGTSSIADDIWAAATLPGWNSHFLPSRALSEDGNRVFFDSYDALVPGDSNGKADVYQWEAPGKGSCSESDPSFSEENGGCVALISSGEGAEDSGFLDASSNGADVFFTTQSSLVPQDYGLRDVYDARVNGGFPAPAAPPPGCEGEACQGVSEAPNDPTPASQSFQGQGNVRSEATKPRRCPKGKAKVKTRGKTRCVKKRNKGAKATKRASENRRASR